MEPILPRRPLHWHPAVEALRDTLAVHSEVYLVGGTVRDAYLHRPTRDIDLVTPGDGRPLARSIANAFSGSYYSLDAERGVGRAIIPWEGNRLVLDVAQFRGPDLETDLLHRDFTINAMAVPLMGDLTGVIDPLGGLRDLELNRLRRCSPESIPSDPIRALRAIRASVAHGLQVEPDTKADLRAAAPRLQAVSPERVRDELFHILDTRDPSAALRALYQLGLLQAVLPEVAGLDSIKQGSPHIFDVWHHTLETVSHLDVLLRVMRGERSDELTDNMPIGAAVFAFVDLRPRIGAELSIEWPQERSHHALLLLGALMHDAAKSVTRTEAEDGRVHFFRHDLIGAGWIHARAKHLHLSNDEADRLQTIVRNHMRPHWLNNDTLTPSGIYRYWRDTGSAGVDICFQAMADYLGMVANTLDQAAWVHYLETVRTLLEHYFFRYDSAIDPPPLVSGRDLIEQFGIEPGPAIGAILEALREAQVEQRIKTKQDALDFAQHVLEEASHNHNQ
ncbi:MAG TPA: HD domain-containing protein [Aggregatilinea sp.]|uniref:CCA tRNA nucleotidyltransferase n=1 Tax=Aggregatilinea sp. TaxID=2806333 RepID=UPI002D19EBCA|nr:HD domain-containing protein [Aggregatilinea sp.]HML20131.1 HD domain-containing protein [Aggregatilinea sp.]